MLLSNISAALKERGAFRPQACLMIFQVGADEAFTTEVALACSQTGEDAENKKNEVCLKIPMLETLEI